MHTDTPMQKHADFEHSQLYKSAVESRYEAETQLIQAVAAGNTEKALAFYKRIMHYGIEPRTNDVLRNSKNMYIILNTLLRKSVQTACIHPLYIDRLSTRLAKQIEAASKSQLEFMPAQMIHSYCALVRTCSRLPYSSIIRSCLDYIDFHYNEELTLCILSKQCAVTKAYLSALFRKEVNVTLTDYIIRVRLQKALDFLNTKTLSIQEIAFDCGFNDPNYFTRMFKRVYGYAPSAYRKQRLTG